MMWFIRGGDEYVSGEEWVRLVCRVEDKVAPSAEAELHAARMIVEFRTLHDRREVAESQHGDAVHALGAQVEDPGAGLVALGYLVRHPGAKYTMPTALHISRYSRLANVSDPSAAVNSPL